ncbi:MAG: repeat-like domain [Planctomycetota bacterium]
MNRRVVACLLLACGSVSAQFPSHGTVINPGVELNGVRFAHAGELVHSVGVTSGPFPNFVHYARSSDGGRTYSIVNRPLGYLGGGGTSIINGLLGEIVAEDRFVAVAVCMPWQGPYLLRSLDGGDTWETPVRISGQYGAPTATRVFANCRGNTVSVVWSESRTTGSTWSNVSFDGGATWQAQDHSLEGGAAPGSNLSVLADGAGDQIHVITNRITTPAVMYYQRSLDAGATWQPNATPFGSEVIRHLGCSTDVVVAATDNAASLRISTDAGSTWTNPTIPGFVPSTQLRSLAVHNRRILLVATPATGLPSTLMLQVSTDAGQTWLAQPYAIGLYRNGTISALAGPDALYVHAAFQESWYPRGVVLQSDDDGVQWRQIQEQVVRGFLPLDAGGLAISDQAPGSIAWVTWPMGAHTRHGAASVGAGTFAPRLLAGGTAGLGKTVDYRTTRIVGGTPTMFFWSVEPLTNQPIGGASLYLRQLIAGRLVTAGGASGVPGVGIASTAVVIPNDPALTGRRLATQAFALDGTVAEGFVASEAIESWVY